MCVIIISRISIIIATIVEEKSLISCNLNLR